MKLKNFKILSVFILFGLCFITHNLYKWIPNNLFAIFFPVNESVWEHMKMIFTTIILWSFIEYFILKKKNIITSAFISGILSIPIYLIMYLPFNTLNMTIIFIILFITLAISQWISYKILSLNDFIYLNKISIILIIVVYIIFGYLTYNPIKCDLFFDPSEEKYGINNYVV